MSLNARLNHLQQEIRQHAPNREVTLVAVSKYATVEQIQAAYHAGLRHFGENKVQDALAKMSQFPPENYPGIQWHLIGPLQRNKINKSIGQFALIHSVESVKLAQALSVANAAQGLIQPVLLQVNLSADATRHGLIPDELLAAFSEILPLPGISVRGLMGMAPEAASRSGNTEALQEVFGQLAHLRAELAQQFTAHLPELSMGMSQDYVSALACGATIIRIGNYLFKN